MCNILIHKELNKKVIRRGTKGTYLKTQKKGFKYQTLIKMYRVYLDKDNKKTYCFFPCQPVLCRHMCRISFWYLHILFQTDFLFTILCMPHVTSAILFPASLINKLYKSKCGKLVTRPSLLNCQITCIWDPMLWHHLLAVKYAALQR